MRKTLIMGTILAAAILATPLLACKLSPVKTVEGKLYFHWIGDEANPPASVKRAREMERPVNGNGYIYTDSTPRVFRFRTRPENAAIRALLAGPSQRERQAGFDTELAYLRLVRIQFDDAAGVATVDLKSTRSAFLGGLLSTPRLGEQVLKTLAQFGKVRTIHIRINGDLNWVEAGPDGAEPGIFTLDGC